MLLFASPLGEPRPLLVPPRHHFSQALTGTISPVQRGGSLSRSTPPSALSPARPTGRYAPPPVMSAAATYSEAEWAQALSSAREGLAGDGPLPAVMQRQGLVTPPHIRSQRLAQARRLITTTGLLRTSPHRYASGGGGGQRGANNGSHWRVGPPLAPTPPRRLQPSALTDVELSSPATRAEALIGFGAAQGGWPGEHRERSNTRSGALIEYSDWLATAALHERQQQRVRHEWRRNRQVEG